MAADGSFNDGHIDDVVVSGACGERADSFGLSVCQGFGGTQGEETGQAGLSGSAPPGFGEHRGWDPTKLPARRFTISVNFADHPKRYWIVVDRDASLCLADPRFEVDLALRTDRTTLYRTYLGHVPLSEAHRMGRIDLQGSKASIRSFIDALQPSPVASIVAAEAPG